jgi:hypothetical protein
LSQPNAVVWPKSSVATAPLGSLRTARALTWFRQPQ